MASKREKLYAAAEKFSALRCPVCGKPLARAEGDFACALGHRQNVNRKGCLNLLSRQTDGCYDAALFEARGRVLNAGCGDGWYLNALLSRHAAWLGAGVDISRDAIARATDQPCEAVWCVADVRKLPFLDGSFTAVLDVLTPAAYAEFKRVLVPDGVLVKVYPGEGYLKEIRAARGLAPYAEGQVDAYLREKAAILDERHVVREIPVAPAIWRDFIWMTPLCQDLNEKEKQAMAQRAQSAVTIDLHVAAVRL